MLASAQRLHAAVLASFPASSTEGRVLWRLDHGDHGRRELLISSATKPDLSALVEECGWPSVETWATGSLDELLSGLREGQIWRFRLTANPVKIGPADGTRGKPIPLTLSGHIPWLINRSAAAGFDVGSVEEPTAMVTRTEHLRFSKHDQKAVSISLSQFDGHLRVTDEVALRGALMQGLGRAKAYGAGLMTLAPRRG
ncbi:type I-E CRISPR-associated protein Cas6/Cse3/CasE [Propionibacteriaceae bacterium G57]|uniref:type I-E CRISPR-associated protein Cas6/Cse3/CasE n=1 Tax=Aestuariimicrobium sp. G57 TaxID=3418485 RepID=UPI003DA7609D